MIEFSWLWQFILSVVAAGLGWFSRELYTDVKNLRTAIHNVELNYVPKSDLVDLKKDMKEGFSELKQLMRDLKGDLDGR